MYYMCLEKGSGQLIVRLTIYAYTSVHNQHQNPFQGTHCSSTISLSRGVKKLETETETIWGGHSVWEKNPSRKINTAICFGKVCWNSLYICYGVYYIVFYTLDMQIYI